MPTRRIGDLEEPCRHPEHDPPKHRVFKPGVYEHVCPKCRAGQTFVVDRPTLDDVPPPATPAAPGRWPRALQWIRATRRS